MLEWIASSYLRWLQTKPTASLRQAYGKPTASPRASASGAPGLSGAPELRSGLRDFLFEGYRTFVSGASRTFDRGLAGLFIDV